MYDQPIKQNEQLFAEMRRWVQTYFGDFYSTHELCLPHHFLRYVATFEFSSVYIVFLHFGDCGYVFDFCENLGGAWISMFSCTSSWFLLFLNAICFLAVVALVVRLCFLIMRGLNILFLLHRVLRRSRFCFLQVFIIVHSHTK